MQSVEARFWSKVDKDGPIPAHRPELGPCWLWTAGTNNDQGYGRFWDGARNAGAHCYAFALVDGPIPDGLLVLHHCDNPPCVRRSHLFTGTHADNMADAAAKGRMPHGERAHTSKLSSSAVLAIRAGYPWPGGTLQVLGAEWGVSRQAIHKIVHRQSWCHI